MQRAVHPDSLVTCHGYKRWSPLHQQTHSKSLELERTYVRTCDSQVGKREHFFGGKVRRIKPACTIFYIEIKEALMIGTRSRMNNFFGATDTKFSVQKRSTAAEMACLSTVPVYFVLKNAYFHLLCSSKKSALLP